jgi:selenocysteine lyase/cysteine desulfurase
MKTRDDDDDDDDDENCIYFNNAAMARFSNKVQEAGIAAITNQFQQDDSMLYSIRKDFISIIGGDDESCIAIMPSTAYAITFAAKNLEATQVLSGGGKILILQDQFCSAIYPWQEIISNSNGNLSFEIVPYPNETETWTELIVARLSLSTLSIVTVCLPPLHWSDGSLVDLVAIGNICRTQGIPLIVDATQAAGAMPLNVKLIQPVMLACSVHKWLRAPSGVCLVYVDPTVHDLWCPLDQNDRGRDIGGPDWDAAKGSMGPNGYPTKYMDDARKFNSGGKPNPLLLPTLQAALREVVCLDMFELQSKLKDLATPLLQWVQSSSVFVLPYDHSYHIMGLRPRNNSIPIEELIEIRDQLQNEYGIYTAIRAGSLRISPYIDNTRDDIKTLVHALTQIMENR